MKEKQAVAQEYTPRYQKATKKAKSAVLDEFTRLTGYHRKSTIKILNAKAVREVMVFVDRKPVKLKPEKKQPANRKGKRLYIDEVIASLMRQQVSSSRNGRIFTSPVSSRKSSKP